MSTSTAVVPFFKVTRGLTGRGSGRAYDVYRCRHCSFEQTSYDNVLRDLRMLPLAQHLADAHQTGPLMAGRANQEAIG